MEPTEHSSMGKNEYTFQYNGIFELEAGQSLPGFQLQYTTMGKLNPDRSNVVWVCHALTGSSDFTSWWGELFTEKRTLNPQEHFIICANMPGGCYGSTGPLSVNPSTGKPFYHDFPLLTNRDVVRAFDLLRLHLGLAHINLLIGGSLGGQQVLEWAILQPTVFRHILPIACNAVHSPWGIAFNEAQRMALEADPTWKGDGPHAGSEGLKAARAIGMISYRHYETFHKTQSETLPDKINGFKASSYQRYQGQKLVNRFNAYTYYLFTKLMDSHNLGRGRKSIEYALGAIQAKTMVIGIDSDLLFPLSEQQFLATHIPDARMEVIASLYGHDGFLVEFSTMDTLIGDFIKSEKKAKSLKTI